MISTAVENYSPKSMSEMTLRAVVAANGFPSTMFRAYVLDGSSYKPVPIDTHVGDLTNVEKIVLQCNRNPDLLQFDPPTKNPPPNPGQVVSIRVPGEGEDGAGFAPLTLRFTEAEAREAVADAVFRSREETCPTGVLFAGLSGGGDSNAMAPGIKRWREACPESRSVVVFTLEFEAIWPSAGTARARALCEKYGFAHEVIDAGRMKTILNLKTGVGEFYFDWVENAGRNTSHGFATYLIAAIARKWLQENVPNDTARTFALGYNREDLLGEVLFSVMNGDRPLAYPVRQFGDERLVMPAWQLPKALLDACFGEFSAENYSERIDRTVRTRGLSHHLAHQLDSSYPGFGMSLLEGLRTTFRDDFATVYHGEYGLWPSSNASDDAVAAMYALCARHINTND